MDTIAETLQADFDAFINQTNALAFFAGLSDYVGYILETPATETIVGSVMREKTEMYDELDRLEQQTVQEMMVAKEKLLKIVKENGIDPKSLVINTSLPPSMQEGHNPVEQLELFESGKVQRSGFMSQVLGGYLFDVAAGLLRLGHEDKLKEFMVSGEEWGHHYENPDPDQRTGIKIIGNTNGNFLFSKTEMLLMKQDAHIDRVSGFGIWTAFDELLKLHEAYVARSKGMLRDDFLKDYSERHPARNQAEAVDVVELSQMYSDLLDVAEGALFAGPNVAVIDGVDHYLSVRDFQNHATRAHRHLLKELAKTEVVKVPGKSGKTNGIVLFLASNGDLYREPRKKYCYPMDEGSDRHKIVRHLVQNRGYQSTPSISSALDGKSEKSIRTEIGKIRANIKKLLKIEGGRVIGGKKESGYRIEPDCKITLKDQ